MSIIGIARYGATRVAAVVSRDSTKAVSSCPAGPGEACQAQQRPGRRRFMDFLAACRAFFLSLEQRGFALRAEGHGRWRRHFTADPKAELAREVLDQPASGDVSAQRVAPVRQQRMGVAEFQGAHPGMIAARQRQSRPVGPALPLAAAGVASPAGAHCSPPGRARNAGWRRGRFQARPGRSRCRRAAYRAVLPMRRAASLASRGRQGAMAKQQNSWVGRFPERGARSESGSTTPACGSGFPLCVLRRCLSKERS